MILHAAAGIRGLLVNLDTGRPIPRVRWANTETGCFEAFAIDQDGRIRSGPDGVPLTYRGQGRLKFIPARPLAPLKDDAPETVPVPRRIPIPLFGDRCQHPGCGRVASWSVSDEVALPPLVKGGRRWSRGRVVGRRHYCSFHYCPPRLLDARGEVIEEFEAAGGVRPQ